MRRADEDVLRWNLFHRGADPVAQHGGKAKKVRADNGHRSASFLQHERSDREVAFPFLYRVRRPDPATDWQQRVRVDCAHRDAGTEFGESVKGGNDEAKQQGRVIWRSWSQDTR